LRIVTVAGEEVAHIADADFPATVAWSHDGLRLAYSPGRSEIGSDAEVVIYDLASGESQVAGVIPQVVTVELLRWSGDDSQVFVGLSRSRSDEIWAVDAQPNSTAEIVLENALLIEAFPYGAN
jgi:Tol biopolymer transport system component